MSQLPDRPDLDQLRRQARELHRAAELGETTSLRRLHAVSDKVTLSTAQLALAREYGFPGWRRLRDEVERRRATVQDSEREGSGRDGSAVNRESGPGVAAWSARHPDLLTADGDELIAGQYADRPEVQPILDAVLAALPPLGPLTVVARTKCVSFVSPRRTFAAAEATTKSRVDLGLRLDGVAPEGRLLAAKNLNASSMNLRIALTGPGDVDDEVRGWLRRAYHASVAPPAPRRPARRPGPVIGSMTVLIDGFDLPGLTCNPGPEGEHQSVHVALTGRDPDRPFLELPGPGGARVLEPVPGDAQSARWEVPVTVRRGDDGLDFGGSFVRGGHDDRHLGLAWGDVPGDGTLRLFRGAKMRLVDVDPALIEAALRPGQRLVARVRLTDAKGNPICARIHPPYLTWSVEPAASG
jgi:Family of unknown function (DUF5990)/Domain of unknown function (DUF5655)